MVMNRRHFTLGGGALALSACAWAKVPQHDWRGDLAALERAHGGRLGAYVLDTGSGRGFGWRQGERFGMCSTFKLSLAAYLLRESDAGRINLAEVIPYGRADLLSHAPVTAAHVDQGGMSIAALAEATQLTSDNTAANLLLRRIGGPQAITGFWRALGDRQSRLDRMEPAMNFVPPGEARDTVTPEGIARSVAQCVVGNALKPPSRARLAEWMERTDTGKNRLRAALPAGWRGGDKTGTASFAKMASKINDIAVFYPPAGRAPLVVAGFYESGGPFGDIAPQDEAVLRQLGEVAIRWAN